ncbi:MAG TPA: hypothetical protein PLC54_00615 [Spirochaetales bacterium]|nr:hypothetical protein [Spirochaetales bacterium]
MKNKQADLDAMERMRPGHITAQGFLGSDSRSLADIIEADAESMRRLDIDADKAADFLEHLRDLGQKGLGEPTGVNGRWIVSTGDARGMLPCPWNDGLFHKNSVSVHDQLSGVRLVYSDLSIHLLREHGFCQGAGSPFRLDPMDIATAMKS